MQLAPFPADWLLLLFGQLLAVSILLVVNLLNLLFLFQALMDLSWLNRFSTVLEIVNI